MCFFGSQTREQEESDNYFFYVITNSYQASKYRRLLDAYYIILKCIFLVMLLYFISFSYLVPKLKQKPAGYYNIKWRVENFLYAISTTM